MNFTLRQEKDRAEQKAMDLMIALDQIRHHCHSHAIECHKAGYLEAEIELEKVAHLVDEKRQWVFDRDRERFPICRGVAKPGKAPDLGSGDTQDRSLPPRLFEEP